MANCVVAVYLTVAAYKAAVEALDDTKFLGAAAVVEDGKMKIVLTRKA